MTPARFRWGMLFIQCGILVLLLNMDIIHEGAFEDLLIYFPFVLIAIGIEKLVTKTRVNFIAYLTTAALFLGGFLIVFSSSAADGYYDDFFSESTYRLDNDASVEKINAVLDLGETDLKIRDSGDDLVYARFNKFIRKPDIETDTQDGTLNIRMNGRSGSLLGGIVKIEEGDDNGQDWYLRFSQDRPLDLECDGYKSTIHLNLTTTMLEQLNLNADESEIYLKVGDMVSDVTIDINSNDSDLKLRLPVSAGLKITGPSLSDYFEQFGLENNGDDEYINDQYDSSDLKIIVIIENRLSSFKLDYY